MDEWMNGFPSQTCQVVFLIYGGLINPNALYEKKNQTGLSFLANA